jgi:hypothetical protein
MAKLTAASALRSIAWYNKEIFGTLYVAGLVFASMRWIAS